MELINSEKNGLITLDESIITKVISNVFKRSSAIKVKEINIDQYKGEWIFRVNLEKPEENNCIDEIQDLVAEAERLLSYNLNTNSFVVITGFIN